MKTQVAIIGGGPSGLLLAQLLHVRGIDSIVLERKTKDYVLGRIRAGVLERGLLDLMREAGVADRMEREGYPHDGTLISYGDEMFRVDFTKHTGHAVMVYGQTEVTRDLYAAREAANWQDHLQRRGRGDRGRGHQRPRVTYAVDGKTQQIDCDFVAGCDGFHGVSRNTIPGDVRREYEKVYPFGWLGILSETPPVNHELIYANSERGFALCSMRNENLSRYYIQCSLSDSPSDWTDAAFWQELKRRIPADQAEKLVTGPSIEKSIAPLRSFVTEPMRWGRLFLCGDAAHIVPPTGAKGLNTAASDVHYLYNALRDFYENGSEAGIESYSANALARVWKAERFSWWFSSLMHRYPDQSAFDHRIQVAELEFLRSNDAAQQAMAKTTWASLTKDDVMDKFDTGMQTRRAVLGDAHVDRAEAAKVDFDAPFQTMITEGAWGTLWSDDAIPHRERSMLTLALLAAMGNFEEIPMHIRATANTGASPQDVLQAFMHVAVYAGVPKANHAIKLAKQTYAEMG